MILFAACCLFAATVVLWPTRNWGPFGLRGDA